jgi:hypothetical protein
MKLSTAVGLHFNVTDVRARASGRDLRAGSSVRDGESWFDSGGSQATVAEVPRPTLLVQIEEDR